MQASPPRSCLCSLAIGSIVRGLNEIVGSKHIEQTTKGDRKMRSSFAHALRLILVGAIAIAVPGAASAGLICTYRDHAANIVRRVQEKLSDQYGPLTADGSI